MFVCMFTIYMIFPFLSLRNYTTISTIWNQCQHSLSIINDHIDSRKWTNYFSGFFFGLCMGFVVVAAAVSRGQKARQAYGEWEKKHKCWMFIVLFAPKMSSPYSAIFISKVIEISPFASHIGIKATTTKHIENRVLSAHNGHSLLTNATYSQKQSMYEWPTEGIRNSTKICWLFHQFSRQTEWIDDRVQQMSHSFI